MITADEFAQAYAELSGIPLEELLKWRRVEPCDCGNELCDGWAMVPNDDAFKAAAGPERRWRRA